MKIKIEESNGVKKYWVNDVCYNSLEDIPAEFKEHFIDKNNNGIPDQFDDLMDSVNKMKNGASLFEVFRTAKGAKTPSQTTSKIDGYSSENEKPSVMPTVIKVVVSIGLVLGGFLLYPKYEAWKNPLELPKETTSVADSVGTQAAENRMKLVIEDPNQAPYHMLGVVYNDGVKLLSFELPDGETTESSDSTLQIAMNVEPGTNLEEKTFSLILQHGACSVGDEELNDGKVTIGKIDFNKSELGDAGAGQQYQTYHYSFEKNGRCLLFILTLHSGNKDAYEPPRKAFDLNEQVAKMENVLKTISGL